MSSTLEWMAAISPAAIIAAIGSFRTEVTARWQARAERLRTDRARRENELHRQRFAEVWSYWHDLPDGPERIDALHWFSEWTGSRLPRRGGLDDGPQTPGTHSPGVDDAYRNYLDQLEAVYVPGRLGSPRLRQGSAPIPALRRRWRRWRAVQPRPEPGHPDSAPGT